MQASDRSLALGALGPQRREPGLRLRGGRCMPVFDRTFQTEPSIAMQSVFARAGTSTRVGEGAGLGSDMRAFDV